MEAPYHEHERGMCHVQRHLKQAARIAVQSYVDKSEATQAQAAKQLGISQPRLNDLLRGRIDKFSVDALIIMLAKVGKQVSIKIHNAA